MSDGQSADHDEIIELLPDYAVGTLDDAELWRVAAHVDSCSTCQRELSYILETVTLLADAPTPRADLKDAVLRRAVGAAVAPSADMPPVLAMTPDVPLARPVTNAAPQRVGGDATTVRRPSSVRRFPIAPLALAAAVLLAVAGFAVWALVLDDDEDDRETIAALLLDPEAAHPINDSELDVGAGGAIFVDDSSDVAYLVASGLPVPGPDQRYQVWLFTQDGDRVPAGFVPVDDDGVGQSVVRAPDEFAAYWAVGVSLEPAGGSEAPTTPLAVGGWLR